MKLNKNYLSRFIDYSLSPQVTGLVLFELLFGAFLVVSSMGVFLKLGDHIIDKQIIFFDKSLLQWAYSIRTPGLTEGMKITTFFGSEMFIGTAILLTIFALLRKHKKDALLFSFILFFGIGLNLLLKVLFHRPRPDLHPLVHESTYSFPSGHSMNSLVFFMALSYFIFKNTRNRKEGFIMTIGSLVLILLIGFSRIYLGAHYPSDVLAGYMAGLWWFVLVILLEKLLYFFRAFRTYEEEKYDGLMKKLK